MGKFRLTLLIIIISLFVKAQDSTRMFNHEVGINTVSLIKQLISNNPGSTLSQLPYDFYYNLHYKNIGGIRIGAGFENKFTETLIEGQPHPRQTKVVETDYRFGITYNIASYKRVTLNLFADYAGGIKKNETVTTTTLQTFPDPLEEITTVSTDETRMKGVQGGVGVKFKLHKHLSIYTEMPVGFYVSNISSKVSVTEGTNKNETKTTTRISEGKVFLPATVYLVLQF